MDLFKYRTIEQMCSDAHIITLNHYDYDMILKMLLEKNTFKGCDSYFGIKYIIYFINIQFAYTHIMSSHTFL